MLHPENVTLDHRLELPDSNWLMLWNEMQTSGASSDPPDQSTDAGGDHGDGSDGQTDDNQDLHI